MSTAERIEELKRRKAELEELAKLERQIDALEYRLLAAPEQAAIKTMVDAVCVSFGVPRTALGERNRTERVARARQACFWLCCEHFGMGYSQVGRLFKRDHGAVMHGCRVIEGAMEVNEKFRERMEKLLRTVKEQNEKQSVDNTDQRAVACPKPGGCRCASHRRENATGASPASC